MNSGKCKFVIAYDVDDNITNKQGFLESISPDNINLEIDSVGTKVIDRFWDNIDRLRILSMNNKSADQIVNFNSNDILGDSFIIKVNLGNQLNIWK